MIRLLEWNWNANALYSLDVEPDAAIAMTCRGFRVYRPLAWLYELDGASVPTFKTYYWSDEDVASDTEIYRNEIYRNEKPTRLFEFRPSPLNCADVESWLADMASEALLPRDDTESDADCATKAFGREREAAEPPDSDAGARPEPVY